MKTKRHILLRIIVAIALIPLLYIASMFAWMFIYVPIHARNTRQMIFQADHARLLTACRDMIANRHLYTNDWPGAVTLSRGEIGIDRAQIQNNAHIPQVIRDMDPLCMRLESNRVVATLDPPPRMYFIGYAEGAREDGTTRLIPGLWYFNGKWQPK